MPLSPIPLASQSYQLGSRPGSATRLMNMVAEKLPDGSRSPFILKPTPGLEYYANLGAGPVVATATVGGALFAISGDHAYFKADSGAAPVDLGVVGGTPSNFYATSIAIGLTGVVFCVPPRAYVTDFAGAAVQEVTTGTGNFPAEGASSVAYIDGYFVFTSFTGTFFFLSALLDPTTYDSLDYVRLSSQVDFFERAVPHNGDLWLFGQKAATVWGNTGAADGPFQPRPGAVIQHGLGAPRTVAEIDGSLFWLGVDNVVYRSRGYRAERVSTHAIEEVIEGYDEGYLRTANACAFMHEGHAFYSLSLPEDGGRTFVYDCATQMWAERSSTTNGLGRWDINTASQFNARVVVGDAINGNLYRMQTATETEKSVAVLRRADLPTLVTHGQRAFMSRLEVEMEVGTSASPAAISVSWSDDGGLNFNTPRVLGAGSLGQTRTRVATTRLGSFRQRVIRLSCAEPTTIYGVDVDAQPGTN